LARPQSAFQPEAKLPGLVWLLLRMRSTGGSFDEGWNIWSNGFISIAS
jgi:hypothetical protein